MFLSFLQKIAPKKIQNRYSQLNQENVDKLLISFLRKEGLTMPEAKIIIVDDIDNKIKYQEVYDKELDRTNVANKRARLEALKNDKLDIEKEIAEIEAELKLAEKVIAIADEKKAESEAEAEAEVVE